MPFRLSTAAAGDLDGIRAFTLERWGRAQWLAYYGELERIAAEPGTGRRRDGFRPGMRSVPCRAHVVFYVELGGGVIGIVRVLHARQNAAAAGWEERMSDGGDHAFLSKLLSSVSRDSSKQNSFVRIVF